jgi:hypothetical protein
LSWNKDVSSKELFLEGLKSLRKGVLLMIIASVVGALAVGLALWLFVVWLTPLHVAIPTPRWGIVPPEATKAPEKLLEELLAQTPYVVALGVPLLVMMLVAVALAIVGLWALFVPGAKKLGRASAEFGTASTLIWIGYFWGVLVLVVAPFAGLACIVCFALVRNVLAVLSVTVGTLIGVFVGAVLALIGFIGSIVLAFKLYELERDSLYLAVAISSIASLVLSFGGLVPYAGPLISIAASALGFIALILLYAALGGSIARASSTTVLPVVS